MKRILFLSFFMASYCLSFAQYTKIYASDDALFKEGIDLYRQQQYSASYRTFEIFLEKLLPNESAVLDETNYYMAANAYELRRADATVRLQAYLQQYPYSPYASEVHFMQGVLYSEKKIYKQAIREFQKVKFKQLSTRHQTDLLFYQGYAFIQTENLEQAANSFFQLLSVKSRYEVSAKYYYAYCLYKQGLYSKALPYFLAIEKNAAYQNIVPYYIIQIYYNQKKYDQVIERAENLLTNNPDNENNGEVHRILGEIYYQQAEYEKTITHLLAYEKSTKQPLRNDIYLLGQSYFQTQDYTEAVKYLSRVTSKKDIMAENAYLHIGNAYINLNDKNQARLAFSAAIRTAFDASVHEEAMFNYALTTYETAAAFGESITAFSDFLKQYPNSKHANKAYEILIDALMETKDYQAAYNTLMEISNPTPRIIEIKRYLLYQMGTDAFATNNFARAIQCFSDVLALQGTKYNTECYFWRSESYYRQGNYENCKADLTTYFAQTDVKSNSNYILAHYSAGYVYFTTQDYATAQKYLLNYVALCKTKDNTYADALNRIGDCYFYARNFVQAESYYTKVIALNNTGADYATFQRGCVLGLLKKYDDKIAVLEKLVKSYSKSNYADDALYEIARAHLMKNNNQSAISAYERLLQSYPNSTWARKSALEIGMVYFNMQSYDACIENYKKVISNYPGSEESYTALEGLENAYIEINRVPEYLAYVKTLGRKIKIDASNNKEDSLTYIAAEHQYITGNYKNAAQGFDTYLTNYCTGGRYCTLAQYYLADSYYRLNEKTKALDAYRTLSEFQGNQYMEEACMRCAEISYDQQDYAYALSYFKKLQLVAGSIENINVARLGILRCSYFLNDYQTTLSIATQIIDDARSDDAVVTEARYNRAKVYLAQSYYTQAVEDLKILSEELRTESGAESKYLLADTYYQQNDMENAENVIMDFASKNTQHQYWLARSFVLLADIYMKKGEEFQAKQYLLSVQTNYTAQDDIQTLITERLQLIEEREREKIN